jgi:hypothetical protein
MDPRFSLAYMCYEIKEWIQALKEELGHNSDSLVTLWSDECDQTKIDVILPAPSNERKKTFTDRKWVSTLKYRQPQTFFAFC